MLEIIISGGWVMGPILLCSVIALAIIVERIWSLRKHKIIPPHLVAQIWHWKKANQLDDGKIEQIRKSSPLGRVLASGLANLQHAREIMKESIEETGRHVVHDLERYLNTLGTVASIAPLLGLLGTVLGIIEMFNAFVQEGARNSAAMASGISVALITTASGLIVAIPAVIFHRYFRGKVDELVVEMEQEAIKMVEIMHGEREQDAPKQEAPKVVRK